MSYVVLARKWRPQTFTDLVGQEAITRTLVNAIKLGRVSHAILLTGSRGVGKTTTARILAKALNCEKGMNPEPCGLCSNCREIAAGSNIDVLEIDGASNTHVEDVREVLDNVRYTPSKSKHKIYIIDEVHMLSKSAFNALLKTLEEPPPNVIFIFATTEPHKIPETVLSRCQRFDFSQISEEGIARHLRKIADAEKISVSDPALALMARQAGGSLRDSLSSLDRVLAFTGDKIKDDDVASILGLTDRALIAKTLGAFVAHDSIEALAVLQSVLSQGFDPKTYLLEIWGRVRDLLVLRTGAAESLVSATSDELAELKKWAGEVSELELERWFDLLRYAAGDVSRVEFPRYVMEVTFLRITRNEPHLPIQTILDRLESLEKRTGSSTSRVASPPERAQAMVSPEPVLTTQKPQTHSPDWEMLVSQVKREKPATAAILLQTAGHEMMGETIGLYYEEGSFFFARAKDHDFEEYLLGVAAKLFGKRYRLEVKTRPKQEKSGPSPVALDRAREREALENPTIQKALSLFEAKIEEIKTAK